MAEAIIYGLAALIVVFATMFFLAGAKDPAAVPASPTAPGGPVASDSDIKAEFSELRKAIERIHETASRLDETTEDAFRDVGKRMDRIERGVDRICDRMDTDARIGSALARLGRPAE